MVDRWVRQVRERGATPTGVDAVPAATVVLMRDGADGLEVLLGRRSSKLAFHGGAWVFPGGRLDPDDYGDDPDDTRRAAARAAVREAAEETGALVEPDTLCYFSHWTTPEISPKRFATWFFAARFDSDDRAGELAGGVVADGSETIAVRWFTPERALDERAQGAIELAPPQFVTLLSLSAHASVDDALDAIARDEPLQVTPRFSFVEDGSAVCVYDDDVAYADLELDRPGRRHRLLMGADNVWVYERD